MKVIANVKLVSRDGPDFTVYTTPRPGVLPSFPWVDVNSFLDAAPIPPSLIEKLKASAESEEITKIGVRETKDGIPVHYVPLLVFADMFEALAEGAPKGKVRRYLTLLKNTVVIAVTELSVAIHRASGRAEEDFDADIERELEEADRLCSTEEAGNA